MSRNGLALVRPDAAPLVQAIPPATAPTASMMADAMSAEIALVEELIAIMHKQRGTVAYQDMEALDQTVFATHRVLGTLAEARRRRRSLNVMLGEREDLPLDALDDALGDRMTESLRLIRTRLQECAQTLSREVAINRHVLRHALTAGDKYIRTLAGVPDSMTYAPQPSSVTDLRGATVLNRRA